jgi:hypothetical protein
MFLIRKISKLVFLKVKSVFSIVLLRIKDFINYVLFLKGKGRFSAFTKSKYFVFFLFFGISICGVVFGFQTDFIKNNTAIIKQSFEKSLSLNNRNQLDLINASSVESENYTNSNNDKGFQNISSSSDVALNSELDYGNSRTDTIENQDIVNKSSLENITANTSSSNSKVFDDEQDNIQITGKSIVSSNIITASSSKTTFSKPTPLKRCEFAVFDKNKPQTVILNEIAWMGSPSSTPNYDSQIILGGSNDEWIELKNTTAKNISFSNWQIIDIAKNINIYFSQDDKIDANSFYLLRRAKDNSSSTIPIDKVYSGALPNSGDKIGIFDENCSLVDEIDASSGWIGGDNVLKKTLERDINNVGWHASDKSGGTPRSQNSEGYKNVLTSSSSGINNISTSATLSLNQSANLNENILTSSDILSSSTSATSSSVKKYLVSVAVVGDGASKIISDSSIDCGNKCSVSVDAGNTIKLKAVPSSQAIFNGWSGACSGLSLECSINVSGYTSISGIFKSKNSFVENISTISNPIIFASSSSGDINENFSIATSSQSSTILLGDISTSSTDTVTTDTNKNDDVVNGKSSLNHLLLFSVQIAGDETSNDFIKIYNTSDSDIQIEGFKLRKKSKTGADYSVKEFSSGSLIKAHNFFTWANSDSNFASSINSDISSSVELSVDNSIALFDKNGVIIDALAWGNGVNQYVEGSAFSKNPDKLQMLQRISKDGVVVDTDNNLTDFMIL